MPCGHTHRDVGVHAAQDRCFGVPAVVATTSSSITGGTGVFFAAWHFLAEIDQVQAGLAGSRMWEEGIAGDALREEISDVCTALSKTGADLGLDLVSARLAALGDSLDAIVR